MIYRDDVLAGRVALITGGGTGMGAHMARGMAEVGATVVVLSREAGHVGPVADELRAAGHAADALVCDVRDPHAVTAAIDGVVAHWGRIDILVNNAAGNFRCPALDLSPNGWRVVIDIDLNGTFFCSQAAARHMIANGGGAILNIVGDNVETHGDRMAHAGAAKAGIWNLTRSLAKEWGPLGIRVNSLGPGPIDTSGAVQALGSAEALSQVTRSIPLGRLGTCEDVTAAAIFLVSPAAAFITGASLMVDGGHSWGGYDLPG